MAVKKSTFTGWKLSGDDAEAFSKQINESRPNERAQEALMRGRVLCKQIESAGYSSVRPKKQNIFKRVVNCAKQLVNKPKA